MPSTSTPARKVRIGNLPATTGATKKRKRIGRGPGSGHGKTSTRGHKGQKARAGGRSRVKTWSEGGQMPLQRRLPKRGFTNIFKNEFQIVNLSDLSRTYPPTTGSVEEMITPALMKEKGLIKKIHVPVKILGDGEFNRAATIQANAFSQKAKEKIEAAGGKTKVIK